MLNSSTLLGSSALHLNWALLAPLIVLGLALLIYCLVDLVRRESVVGGSKLVWAAVILLGGTLGQIVYLIVGRGEG